LKLAFLVNHLATLSRNQFGVLVPLSRSHLSLFVR
jgi:hypothetical protein